MADLQIAYYFIVIMIGFAALAISGFWAIKTKDFDLRNFWVVYAAFTLLLIVSVLKKYLYLNVEGYSASTWYFISGISQVLIFFVVFAIIQFLLSVYQISSRRSLTWLFFFSMLICVGIIYSPFGAVLDADKEVIQLGIGFLISSVWYLIAFTFSMIVGYAFLRRVWNTDKRNLILGFLIFATFGYIENLLSIPDNLGIRTVPFGEEADFLYSSIPYALFGFFILYYFLRFSPATPLGLGTLSDNFLSTYNITDREREIIQKVIEGKSNADIANELFISLATVKTHLHNIYQKVDVNSRYDLLARVRSSQ